MDDRGRSWRRALGRLAIGGLAGALLIVVGFAPSAMAAPVSFFNINSVALTEGDAGTSNLTFTISYTGTKNDISVDWATANGAATAGADYVASAGTASFTLAGPTSQTITIPVNGDLLDEANETFTVNLTNAQPPATAAITTSTGTGTINDNDATPSIVINDVSLTEGNTATSNADFAVTLSAPSGRTVTVNYATANGTAVQPGDYTTTPGTLTFTPGQVLKTISVPIVGDLIDENNETYVVNLSGASNATIADTQGAGTIVNDDTSPSIAIDDPSLTEGNSGTTNLTFSATLSSPSGKTVTVAYAAADGTAVAPTDYTAVSGTVTFTPGQTSRPITVAVRGDTLDEFDEAFAVNLSSPTNATIADSQGVGTIVDNDAPPSFTVNNVTVTEVDAGTVTATFTVTASAVSGKTMMVDYATADGTATAPADYAATSGTLTFAPGQTTQPIAVTVPGDLLDEANETYTVRLTNPVNATTSATGTGTITDNDATPSLVINDVSVTEGDAGTTIATYTVTLSAPSGRNVTVNYATANGTAVQPGDYTAATGTLTFPPGTTTQPIDVTVLGDLLNEANETYVVNLSAAANATIADSQGAGTIVNDDPLPSLSIDDVTLTELNVGTSVAAFTVSLSAPSGRNVTVNYATANGTAVQPGDYTAASGTLTFAAGTTGKTVNVLVVGDLLNELDETFVVNLSAPGNATIADSQGAGTIANDDPVPSLAINDVSLTEGNSGTTNLVFTLSLAAASGKTVTVSAATANDVAVQPADYTATSSTVTFTPGQTTRTFSVPVRGDIVIEPDETFFVNLSGATNATIADAQGIGTIVNNDFPPTISINDPSLTEGDAGTTNLTFTVALSWATGSTVTVGAATANDTAVAPGDFTATAGTVTFIAGQTSRTFVVPVRGDLLDEPDETFFVDLSGATNATIADAQGIGTIVDNDPVPSVVVNDVSVTEGNSGTSIVSFSVVLSAASSKTITVDYSTSDGSAVQPDDYASASGTVTFNPGQTSKTIDVTVSGDLTYELDETFGISLSNPTNAVPGGMSATATIQDDDALPAISVDDRAVSEGDVGSTMMTFTVSLSNPSAAPTTVDVATVDDTAVSPADYTPSGAGLIFNPGEVSRTIDVAVAGDGVFEGNERLEIHLSNVAGASVADGVGVGTIVDDEVAPALNIDDVTVTEGDGGPTTATFTVGLTGSTAVTATVDVATTVGTADPTDFDANTATLTFLPGETTHTFGVVVHGDTTYEGDEVFTVQIANPTAAQIVGGVGVGVGVGTIANDDGAPGLSVDDVTVSEGDVGTTPATFTVGLSNPSSFPISVDLATQDGTAVAPGDYDVTSSAVTFQPGETSHTVDVPVEGDTVFEGNETFAVRLSNASGASVAIGTGTATILDDEGALTLSVDDVDVPEGDSGSSLATFTVSLSTVSATAVDVDFATHDGSAEQPQDYAPGAGSLTFAPGETWKTVDVAVQSDTAPEPNETFTLDLANAAGAGILDGSGTATILDDDLSSLQTGDVTVVEGALGSTSAATFFVRLSDPLASGTSVGYETRDGTATAGIDYTPVSGTLIFQPGQTLAAVDVPVIGDDDAEADETFTLQLSGGTGARLDRDVTTGTILNDDDKETMHIALRASGRHHRVVTRGRMPHAEPGMRVKVVLLKRVGSGFVKIARDTVTMQIHGRGGMRTGIFTARFLHQSRGRFVVRAVFRGDSMHRPARAHARVRL